MKTEILNAKHDTIIYCKSGRVQLCLNEQEVQVKVPNYNTEDEPTGTYSTETHYQYDIVWLKPLNHEYSSILEALKKEIQRDIAEFDYESYDNDGLHTFSINDTSMWFYREERCGLKQRIEAEQAAGKTTTNIWHETTKFEMPIETALQILNDLEVYSSEVYDIIQQHKANIENCTTIEEVAAYDIKAGFPEKLSYTL